jgi:UDP-N-acetylmuramoyl-tripeptide--D-alanyl-D-alanine ligase
MATAIPENHARFRLLEIAEATGGVLFGEIGGQTLEVVSDSRRVTKDCLFVALRGENHDAHSFASLAVDGGARAALVERATAFAKPASRVEVDDTLRALGDLASFHRARWGGRVVAITGSAGKTTTKELTAAALGDLAVAKTIGNLNNLVGVPHTLFTLQAPGVAVVEIGTSKPGEIARLAEIAKPNLGLVTCVAVAHTEGLGSLEAVALEKTSLLRDVEIAIVNRDDEVLWEHASRVRNDLVGYGVHPEARTRLLERTLRGDLKSALRVRAGDREVEVVLSLVGGGAAANATAALSVASALGADLDRAARDLATVAPVAGRLELVRGKNDVLVLDDSYNANPASMRVAFETAGEIAALTKRSLVAVVGDMKELGADSERAHREVAAQAEKSGARAMRAVGVEMAAARSSIAIHHAALEPALDAIERSIRPGDLVLVKGSRSMRMERVVERLREAS